MELSAEQVKALVAEDGADLSDDAAEELAEILENYIGYITEEALGQATEAGRDVITKEDILEAER